MDLTLAVVNALVLPHGLTDVGCYEDQKLITMYTVCTLVCSILPRSWLMYLLIAGSMLHFANDVDVSTSVLLVGYLFLLHQHDQSFVAWWLLIGYMTLVHLPLHYAETLPCSHFEPWHIAAVGTLCVMLNPVGWLHNPIWARLSAAFVLAHVGLTWTG